MKLLRLGSTGKTWPPEDLSGVGAAQDPGRWNALGEKVVYSAPTLAMAVLETAAHVNAHGLPLNRYVVEIDVPADLWEARKILRARDLPVGWDAVPHGIVSIRTGSDWYGSGQEALIELPSAIVPEESIVLINAQHADTERISAKAIRKFEYNLLFR